MSELERDLHAVGDRIEYLIGDLRASAHPATWERIDELLRLVTDLYGAGLERVAELVSADDFRRLADDDLVASLFVLHGLHPEDVIARVERALEEVRPYLASHGGGVELLGVDEEEGVVRLSLLGACNGCPSSSATLRQAVDKAIEEAAPEIVRIDTAGATVTNGPGQPVPVLLGPTR